MSGRKNNLPPYHAIIAGDMSGTLTSPVTTIDHLDNVAVQLVFTGTPTGAFNVQGSLDKVTWITLSLTPNPAAAGAAGNILLDLNQLSFPYIRIQYVPTSGAGSLDMWISAKMV